MIATTNDGPQALKPAGLVAAPVVPSPSAAVRLRPLDLRRSRIGGGIWAARRLTNRDVTIPHGAAQLETAGNLANFRLAAGASGAYRGGNDELGTTAPFLDSDVYKWLEAVGWELATGDTEALSALANPVIELVAKAQRADGYLDTYFQVAEPGREFTNMRWGHELYVAGHLAQAAVAWMRVMEDDRLLGVAERYIDRIEAELGPGRRELVCGHPELEMALVELYRTTGRARYLDFARLLLDRRGRGLLGGDRFGNGYWQDHEAVRTAAVPVGHAVRQVYLDCGVVDVAVETGDRELLGAAVRRWEALRASRMYLTGGLGSHHRDEALGDAFELPPDRAYAETCAAIGSTMLAWRLLLATGESRYADVFEQTAFNAVLGGLASDGRHFFYSNPLMRRSSGLEVLGGAATTRRAEWFPVSCCPPNLMRFLAMLPAQVATVDGTGIQLHQFASGSIEAEVGGGRTRIDIATDYPWQGDVVVSVGESAPEPWKLSIRVPGWCPRATARLGDAQVLAVSGPGTMDLTRAWAAGDTLTLRLEMDPAIVVPDPRIDAVRGTVALQRGPVVYAVEDADLPPGGSVESLQIDPATTVLAVPEPVPDLGEIMTLAFEAELRTDPPDIDWPYVADGPAAQGEANRPTRIWVKAVPYFWWANRPGLGMRVWLPTLSTRDAAQVVDGRLARTARRRGDAWGIERGGMTWSQAMRLAAAGGWQPGRARVGPGRRSRCETSPLAAGVSPSTVSRVLNDSPSAVPIAEGTRQRVTKAARKLEYRPNPHARSLRGAPTMLIGAVVRDFSDPFFADAIEALAVEAMAHGYNIVLGHIHGRQHEGLELTTVLETRQTDAVMMLGYMQDQPRLLADLQRQRSPSWPCGREQALCSSRPSTSTTERESSPRWTTSWGWATRASG